MKLVPAVMLVAAGVFSTASAAWLIAATTSRVRDDGIARTFCEVASSIAFSIAIGCFISAWANA